MICCLDLFIASDQSNPLTTLKLSFASVFDNALAAFGTIKTMARACSSALAAVLELYCKAVLQDNMMPWGLCFNTLVTFGVLAFCTLRFHILYIFHKFNIKIKLHLHLDLDGIKFVFRGLRTTTENLP